MISPLTPALITSAPADSQFCVCASAPCDFLEHSLLGARETGLLGRLGDGGVPCHFAGVGSANQGQQSAGPVTDISEATIDTDWNADAVKRLQHEFLLTFVGHPNDGPWTDQGHEHLFGLVRVQRCS